MTGSADTLTEAALALIEQPVIAHFATAGPDGWPQVTPVWVDHEGTDVLINTAEGRVKPRFIRENPRVAISLTAPNDPYNALALRGTVVSIATEGADEHIDKLAKKYLGADSYPMRTPGEVRVIVRVRPDRIVMQPAGSA
jgi:PPOX class probable F420-dependent enzyme